MKLTEPTLESMLMLATGRMEQVMEARLALMSVYRATDLKHAQDLAAECLQKLNAMDNALQTSPDAPRSTKEA